MNRILVQANKEWVEFRRDRLSLALAFLLPLFSLLLFSYGIRLESKNIPLAVEDADHTPVSREYVHRLYATNMFIPAACPGDGSPSDAIDRSLAKVGVVIPPGFAGRLFAGQVAPMQVLIDGTDISDSMIIINSIKAVNSYFLKSISHCARNPQAVVPHLRIWFNPGRKESLFIVPGVFGVILWMYPALLAAVAASREKEQQTIIRVFSSRLSAFEFLFGKTLVYVLIGLGLALVILVPGCLLFRICPVGDPTPLLVATPLYLFTSVLFGILVGTYANSQTVAVQATSTLGFFPCLLLSGFVYPVDNIPFPLSAFSLVVPARYYINLCRDAFERGIGWPAVYPDSLMLLLFIAIMFTISFLGICRMQLKD